MSLFLLIIISGEHFGGFYLLYIIMGLYGGASHAILAFSGLLFIFTGYKIYRVKQNILKPFLYLVGISLMVVALVTFFVGSHGYNNSTFHQTIPILSLVLFSLSAFFFVIHFLWLSAKIIKSKSDKIGIAS